MNGEWIEDQLDNPIVLDVILYYLRLERFKSSNHNQYVKSCENTNRHAC